jgi:hypothetical protein
MIPTNGDATLLRFTEGNNEVNILIDGGNRRDDCLSYLKGIEVDNLDLLIASHLDEDHIRGLRRVADEISIDELWISDISPLAKQVPKHLYVEKCWHESRLIIDSKGIAGGKKVAVYDGYRRQLGPFFLEVLSPPKTLHDYLRRPNIAKRILQSTKGQSIGQYIRDKMEKRLQERNGGDGRKNREEVVSEVIEELEVEVPQKRRIEELMKRDGVDWREHDTFYESARSLFNDISIVVKITYDYDGERKTFLFPGDLTNWSLLMATHPHKIRRCITKIPHHGSEIYVNAEDYANSILAQPANLVLWSHVLSYGDRMPGPRVIVLPDSEAVQTYLLLPAGLNVIWPAQGLDFWAIYDYLSPEHSLIYPYKSSFCLPRLDVRNAIRAHSFSTSCNFEQGEPTKTSSMRGADACMKCYHCVRRDLQKAIRLDWS